MQIFPFDKNVGDVLSPVDLSTIQAEGISIRSGNKVLRFTVTEESVVTEDAALRQELTDQFDAKYQILAKQFEEYRASMRNALDTEKMKIRRAQEELDRKMKAVSVLPNLTEDHMYQGLSVAIASAGGLMWSFKTVYAPKMLGNRRIEPEYAKRLVTPVIIEVRTNASNKVHSLVVRKFLGGEKFYHYHSLSNDSDCWGQFRYSGRVINTPEEMIAFCKEASFLLEVINDLSIASRNPRGLCRLDTLRKHLLDPEAGAPEGNARNNATNSRNERAGVVTNLNEDVAENVWSV